MEEASRKSYILQVAMEKAKQVAIWKDSKQNPISASAFSVLHQCMAAVNVTEGTEKSKKNKLVHNLQNYWRGKNPFVEGCKREHIQKIISLLFGIKDVRDKYLYYKISSFTFQELYLYYCYVERLAKNDGQALKLFHAYNKEQRTKEANQRQAIAQQELKEHLEPEGQPAPEGNQPAPEEQSAPERNQPAPKGKPPNPEEQPVPKGKHSDLEGKHLALEEQPAPEGKHPEREGESPEAISSKKKWKDDIYNNQKDMQYFFDLSDPQKYGAQEKAAIAQILKEYWEKEEKWEGGAKVSKKQVAKIQAIKGILGE